MIIEKGVAGDLSPAVLKLVVLTSPKNTTSSVELKLHVEDFIFPVKLIDTSDALQKPAQNIAMVKNNM